MDIALTVSATLILMQGIDTCHRSSCSFSQQSDFRDAPVDSQGGGYVIFEKFPLFNITLSLHRFIK